MKSVIEQIKDFLAGPERNRWMSDDKMEVYVRKSRRSIEGNTYNALDIANIGVFNKSQGTFRDFVTQFHSLNPYDLTYIESVHSPVLLSWCERHGWAKIPNIFPPTFYMPTKISYKLGKAVWLCGDVEIFVEIVGVCGFGSDGYIYLKTDTGTGIPYSEIVRYVDDFMDQGAGV